MVAAGYGVACGSSSNGTSSSFPGNDGGGGGGDAGSDAQVACGGCGCDDVDSGPASVTITAAQACDLAANDLEPGDAGTLDNTECQTYCGASVASCNLDPTFVASYAALNADAGALDASADDGGANQCPAQSGGVALSCTHFACLGRLTEGFATPNNVASLGDRFAAMAYLEAVSVHAFDRLERELRAHGACADLLRDARRAKRDEQRHTVTMAGLARRNGCDAKMPETPQIMPVRTLLEVAMENAVEGCVRETYGAVVGLIEGETSTSTSVRRAMRSVSADECRHAELAWAVHAWAMPQLSADEAREVEIAMREAIDEIAQRDAKIAKLLFDDTSRIVA